MLSSHPAPRILVLMNAVSDQDPLVRDFEHDHVGEPTDQGSANLADARVAERVLVD